MLYNNDNFLTIVQNELLWRFYGKMCENAQMIFKKLFGLR